MNLKETALAYEPTQTKNISNLQRIPIDIEIQDDEFTFVDKDNKEKTVKQKVFELEGETYKIPNVVLSDLKELLTENPKIKYFKVNKKGEGMKTRYTVIPLGDSGVVEESV